MILSFNEEKVTEVVNKLNSLKYEKIDVPYGMRDELLTDLLKLFYDKYKGRIEVKGYSQLAHLLERNFRFDEINPEKEITFKTLKNRLDFLDEWKEKRDHSKE